MKKLPSATKPLRHYPRASACAGPVYYYNDYQDCATRLPEIFDSCLIVFDWTNASVRVIKLDENGDAVWDNPWLGRHLFIHPVDMQMGKNGELYLLEYGTPWYDGTDGRLKKITYTETPIEIDWTFLQRGGQKYAKARGPGRPREKNPSGGEGSWGLVPMPPHPPHNIEETQQMVDTILGMRKEAE